MGSCTCNTSGATQGLNGRYFPSSGAVAYTRKTTNQTPRRKRKLPRKAPAQVDEILTYPQPQGEDQNRNLKQWMRIRTTILVDVERASKLLIILWCSLNSFHFSLKTSANHELPQVV